MAKKKKIEQCLFVIEVPRKLKLDFRKVCHKQGSTAKNAIQLLMRAAIDGKVRFNKSLKFTKKIK